MKKKIISKLFVVPAVLGLVAGFFSSIHSSVFSIARADDVTRVQGSYCSTNTSSNSTAGELYFNMLANDAPYNSDWSNRYRPLSDDCVTITRNGETHNLATNRAWDMIAKYSETGYCLVTWMMGDYKPQLGDIYTIKGDFVSRDTDGSDPIDGKFILNIKETSFIYSKLQDKTYFAALPQVVADGGTVSMPLYADQNWAFQIDLNSLEQSDAPVTGESFGDDKGYYPTSAEDVFIDGEPVAKVEKQAFRRRDSWGYTFYVCALGDMQGWNNIVQLDSLVVFDGTFVYKGDVTLSENRRMGFSLSEAALHKIGNGVNDYEVVNFRPFLVNKILSSYDIHNYSDENALTVSDILDNVETDLAAPTTVKAVYAKYNEIVATLDAIEMDPEAAARYLEELKEAAINEINNYVDLDNYFPAQQAAITGYINDCITAINSATTKADINLALNSAKANIDAVKVKKTVMTEAVEARSSGYEEYLAVYNRVSLNDLNVDNQVFHGRLQDRQNDFKTNPLDNEIRNTFVPVSGNENGNVIFQFKYMSNATPVGGANFCANLRGRPYYGYKFNLGTNTYGFYVEVLSESGSQFLGGTENSFPLNTELSVEIGAIDLIDYDITWLFVKVNGAFKLSKVVDSLSFCVNPRVALSPNDNNNQTNDYEGTTNITNYNSDAEINEGAYLGTFRLGNQNDTKNYINVRMDVNDIPYDSSEPTELYSFDASQMKLISGDSTTEISKYHLPSIQKYGASDYRIMVSSFVDVIDNDQIVIQGTFTYFDSQTGNKMSVTFGKCTFVYQDGTWDQVFTLEEIKEDACKRLETYVDLSLYDEEDVVSINQIINQGKVAINACTSKEQVEQTLNQYMTQIDGFKTTFRKAQDAAIAIVNAYKNDQLDQYREDEINDMKEYKDDAIEAINNALTYEEINAIVEDLMAKIDRLKTKDQYEAEELEAARQSGIQEIQNYYGSIDLSKLSEAQRDQLNKDTASAIEAVKAATTIEQINSIVEQYKTSHVYGGQKSKGCGGSLVTTGSIISIMTLIASALLLTMLIIKRKKAR